MGTYSVLLCYSLESIYSLIYAVLACPYAALGFPFRDMHWNEGHK